jgi:hypothetical protein
VQALLFLSFALGLVPVYVMNDRVPAALETTSAGYTARSLLRDGDLDVKEFFPRAVRRGPEHGVGYAFRWREGALYAIEPVASSLTFVPFLLLQRGAQARPPLVPDPVNQRVAAQVASLTAAVLVVWLLTVTTLPRALLAAGVVALATSHWTVVGTELWQHTSGTLWLSIGLFAWWHAPRRPWLYPWAGAALALATACRPVLVAVPLALLVDVGRVTRPARGLVAASVLVVAGIGGLALFGNWALHGSLLGGRVDLVRDPGHLHAIDAYFRFSPVHWAGLLASPSRGLFVFSPVLLFGLPGLVRCLRGGCGSVARLASASALASFGLYGFVATWWAGSVFGPRYMTDLLPFFALWLAVTPLTRKGAPVLGLLFAAALAWSLWVQYLGATAYPCGWNRTPVMLDAAPERVWSWWDSQIARCAGWHRLESASPAVPMPPPGDRGQREQGPEGELGPGAKAGRTELEADPVRAGIQGDSAEQVVRPVDRDLPVVEEGPPPGVVEVAQHQVARGGARHGDHHALRLVARD